MKILGGNQVVFYTTQKGNLEVKLTDCLEQLEVYMDKHQIYPGSFIRHNIFLNITDQGTYDAIKPKLAIIAKRRFPLPMLVNVIPLTPAEGELALESTYIKSTSWNCLFKESKYGSCQLMKKDKVNVVIGSVQVHKYPDMQKNAEKAFEQMEGLLDKCGLGMGDLVKQWSYIEHLLDEDILTQRYQTFNDVRTRYYDIDFSESGYPASTEVGIHTGGIIIEFLAVNDRDKRSLKINNPRQKAPHEYSQEVLATEGAYIKSTPTTPKLERARSLSIDNKTMVFISGTSSIIGERITAGGDVKEQTVVALENIKKISSLQNLGEAGIQTSEKGTFTLIKAYVNSKLYFEDVYDLLSKTFVDIPLVLVQTDLPRKDILVELEVELML